MDLNYGKNLTQIISILSVFYWLWWQLVRAEHVSHTHDFNMDDIFHGDKNYDVGLHERDNINIVDAY